MNLDFQYQAWTWISSIKLDLECELSVMKLDPELGGSCELRFTNELHRWVPSIAPSILVIYKYSGPIWNRVRPDFECSICPLGYVWILKCPNQKAALNLNLPLSWHNQLSHANHTIMEMFVLNLELNLPSSLNNFSWKLTSLNLEQAKEKKNKASYWSLNKSIQHGHSFIQMAQPCYYLVSLYE